MSAIQTLAGILGLSFVSGINLYAAVLVVGLGIRFHWLSGLPEDLHVLANPVVIGLAGAVYLLGFVVDKVPFLSVMWDGIHTFIRPVGGALLALAVASHASPLLQVIAFLVGGSVALGTHSTKMGVRILAHSTPEPVSNSILSVGEDLSVIGLIALLHAHPLAVIVVVAAALGAMAVLTPFLYRVIVFIVRGVLGWLGSWIPTRGKLDCPEWLAPRLREISPEGQERLFRCFARSCRKAPRLKAGYLIWTGDRPYFAFRKYFRPKVVQFGGEGSPAATLQPGALFDVLAFGNAKNRPDTLYLSKDWSARFQAQTGAVSEARASSQSLTHGSV